MSVVLESTAMIVSSHWQFWIISLWIAVCKAFLKMAIGLEKGKVCGVYVFREGGMLHVSWPKASDCPTKPASQRWRNPREPASGFRPWHWQLTFILGGRLPVFQHFPLASASAVSVLEIEVPLAWDDYWKYNQCLLGGIRFGFGALEGIYWNADFFLKKPLNHYIFWGWFWRLFVNILCTVSEKCHDVTMYF